MPSHKHEPASPPCHDTITLLTISPHQEDRRSLKSILDPEGWTIQGAASIREATNLMKQKPSLVVCDRELPDGTWQDIYREASRLEIPPPLVVVSRNVDRSFWAEVFNIGAFDVLMKPFERSEVRRVMTMAARHMAALAAA